MENVEATVDNNRMFQFLPKNIRERYSWEVVTGPDGGDLLYTSDKVPSATLIEIQKCGFRVFSISDGGIHFNLIEEPTPTPKERAMIDRLIEQVDDERIKMESAVREYERA